jgi:hypothetical protein
VALVVEGLGEGFRVDEGVAGGETRWGWGDYFVVVCEQFVTSRGLLALFDLHNKYMSTI